MRQTILLTLLFVLIPKTSIHAQDFVYSVTLGTSWARQEFPQIERTERKKLEQNRFTIAGAPHFSKTFLDYEYDYKRFNTYNDSIFFPLSSDEWISMFRRRAKKYSELYSKNNSALAIIKDYFYDTNVPEAAYDSLYYWTRHLMFRNTNDMFMYEQMMDILIPHYEEKQDIEHLMLCYLCSGMYNYQWARMGDKESKLRSELYFHKMMNMADRFASFKDPLNRYYLISAFVNLAILHSESGNISLRECKDMAVKMQKIYDTQEVQQIMQKDSLLNEYSKWSIDVFNFRGILNYISLGYEVPELRSELYKNFTVVRDRWSGNAHLKNRYYGKMDYDNLVVEAYMGKMSYNDAFAKFDKMLAAEPDFTSKTGVPQNKIHYIYNLSQEYISLLEQTTYPFEKKAKLMKSHISSLIDIIARYEHNKYPFEKGEILSSIACNPSILKYLSPEEKSELMFRLIVVEQPTTFVHVSMVADLSVILAESLIANRPDYFVGVPGFQTVDDVKTNKETLIDLVRKSALYHDLGKIAIPIVVENNFRKLTDHEFEFIQLHPEMSRRFFAIDESLKPYIDVALGHHKWYDGDGYPSSFKNRKSPYFPIISIVTVTDCMDAATENIGRNYHTPKEFDDVISEFVSLSGEQFHPVLINHIVSNKALSLRLKEVVNDGRYENYYKLYKRYMTQE